MSKKSKNLELELPHKAPIFFAKKILSRELNRSRVYVEFDEIPSLAMLVESAAQSTSAIDKDSTIKNAYLVSMKNIELLTNPKKKYFEVEVVYEHNLEIFELNSV